MGSNPITRFRSPVAQLKERLSYKQEVAGLSPAGTITFGSVAQWREHRSSKPGGVGSSPAAPARIKKLGFQSL